MRPTAVLLLLLAGCAPKIAPAEGAPPPLERLPADALLWEGEIPVGVQKSALQEKVGVLARTKRDAEEEGRWWPYTLDYWRLTRTDLDTLLAPHVGRRVRVLGHYKRIYDDGRELYEVDPVKITALADPPAP